jgi:dCMP deaminase
MEPHEFVPSKFEKGSVRYCGYDNCGMQESNPIHGLKEDHHRLDRLAYLVAQIQLTARRSTCNRGQVGAIIVREGRIISQGYNGAPPGMPHCTDVGCEPADGCERTVHAEANAIAWAARAGISTEGASMYCTHGPCVNCAKLVASSGISTLSYLKDYHAQRLDILEATGVTVIRLGV